MTIAPHIQTRLRHLSCQLHDLGPRPLFELLKEVADGADLMPRLEVYAAMDRNIVAALGADRMPPRARMIGGAR